MKKCTKCNTTKPKKCFDKRIISVDGLSYKCKNCCILYRKEYRKKYKERLKEQKARDYQNRKEYINKKSVEWARNNPEKRKIITKRYRQNNKHVICEIQARRRKGKNSKLSILHKKEMREFYRLRKQGYEVDHIIPLCGDTVSGLHVPWNLQYLTISENRKKSNKLEQCS